MPTQANQPLPDGYRLERYRIAGVLCCGGFSIVYLGYDENGQPVAIKEYLPAQLALRKKGTTLPSIGPDNVSMFRHGLRCFFEEGRALAGLSHPNVVKVLNFFRANDTAYLVMRYERGRTLQEHIRARGAFIKEEFLPTVFIRLLNGLREVHAHKLLHLDLKPANIYVRHDGEPMLIDFGAARQTLNAVGARLNPTFTPGFAAPEHYRREGLGPWSDIYGVGASLYACLAGEAPPAADQRLIRDRYVPATRRWKGRHARDLLETVDWCLELDPLKRPASVYLLQKVLLGMRGPRLDFQGDLLSRVRGQIQRFASIAAS